MVLKDKKRTDFRINLYFDSFFLYSQHPGWFTICVSEAERHHFSTSCHKWLLLCYWVQTLFPCCGGVLLLSPAISLLKQRFHLLAKPQRGSRLICLKTKAFFIQPGWWEDQLGLTGVWDKAAQGSLVSQHMQRHLPGKPKSSAAEVNPSSLACKPLGFRLNEPGRKAEASQTTHSQGGSTKKRGRDGNIFNSGVPAKRSTSSLQNDFPPEHSEIF